MNSVVYFTVLYDSMLVVYLLKKIVVSFFYNNRTKKIDFCWFFMYTVTDKIMNTIKNTVFILVCPGCLCLFGTCTCQKHVKMDLKYYKKFFFFFISFFLCTSLNISVDRDLVMKYLGILTFHTAK